MGLWTLKNNGLCDLLVNFTGMCSTNGGGGGGGGGWWGVGRGSAENENCKSGSLTFLVMAL